MGCPSLSAENSAPVAVPPEILFIVVECSVPEIHGNLLEAKSD
jgi:hypothetical protein